MLIGNECEEEVECELLWLEVSDPLFGSQSMVEPSEVAWNFPYAIWDDGNEWFFQWHDCNSKWLLKCLLNSDVCDTVCYMRNRLVGIDVARKPQKLESLLLAKPSDLCLLYLPFQSRQSADFTEIAETEVDSKKKIQQIKNCRLKGDPKLLSL